MDHANTRYDFYGSAPEITKLYGGRYRIVVRCELQDLDQDWFYENESQIWKDFGDLYELPLNMDGASDGWEPIDGEVYPNQKLIGTQLLFIPQKATPTLEFTYETLTSTYTQESADAIDYELNGLRRVVRTLIAIEDSNYSKEIGVETISHQARGQDVKTLYLATADEDDKDSDEGGYTRIREVWVEPGILNESKRNLSEGVVEVTKEFLAVQGSTVGPITRTSTNNVEGLKTISVTTLQDKDGNSIVDGGSNLVHRYERKVPFTYPGTIGIRQDKIDNTDPSAVDPILFNYELKPPVEAKVNATVSVTFQTSGNITAADEIYDDGAGAADSYWNPTQWAETYVSGIGWQYRAFSETQGLRGYRADTDVSGISEIVPSTTNDTWFSNGILVFYYDKETASVEKLSGTSGGVKYARIYGNSDSDGFKFTINSKRLYASTPFLMEVRGGPDDPSGTKYVLDIDIRPAFDDIEGNVYYKKTIVTATV